METGNLESLKKPFDFAKACEILKSNKVRYSLVLSKNHGR